MWRRDSMFRSCWLSSFEHVSDDLRRDLKRRVVMGQTIEVVLVGIAALDLRTPVHQQRDHRVSERLRIVIDEGIDKAGAGALLAPGKARMSSATRLPARSPAGRSSPGVLRGCDR
jgi:hypothetical protein